MPPFVVTLDVPTQDAPRIAYTELLFVPDAPDEEAAVRSVAVQMAAKGRVLAPGTVFFVVNPSFGQAVMVDSFSLAAETHIVPGPFTPPES